jgi:hypothetical protein
MKQNKYGVVFENGVDTNKWMVNSSDLSGIEKSVLGLFDTSRDTVSRIYIPQNTSYNGQTFVASIVLNVSRGVQSSNKAGFIHALYGDDITAGERFAADALTFNMQKALSDNEANNRPTAADGYDERTGRYVDVDEFSDVKTLNAASDEDILNILTLLLRYKHVAIDADNQDIIDAAIYQTLTKLSLPAVANRISFNSAATTVDAAKQASLCGVKDLPSAGKSQLPREGYAVYKMGSIYDNPTKKLYQQLLFGGAEGETQQYLTRYFNGRDFADASAEAALDELDNALKQRLLDKEVLLSARTLFEYSDSDLQERIDTYQQSQSFEQLKGQHQQQNFAPRQYFLDAEKALLDGDAGSPMRKEGEVELRLNRMAFRTAQSGDFLSLLWGLGTVIVGVAVPTLIALILAAVNIPWEQFFAKLPVTTLVYYLPPIVATILSAVLYYTSAGKAHAKCKKTLLVVLLVVALPYFLFAAVSAIVYFI